MSIQFISPPPFLVAGLTRLVGAGLTEAELDLALAQAYTSILTALGRATAVSGMQLTEAELAAGIASGAPEFAAFTSSVTTAVNGATNLAALTEGWSVASLRTFLPHAARQLAQRLAQTATLQVIEVTATETAVTTAGGTALVRVGA